jgi:hypothetical protein
VWATPDSGIIRVVSIQLVNRGCPSAVVGVWTSSLSVTDEVTNELPSHDLARDSC